MKIKNNKMFGLVLALTMVLIVMCGFTVLKPAGEPANKLVLHVYFQMIQANHPELKDDKARQAYAYAHADGTERVWKEYDAIYYRANNPDLDAAFGDNWSAYYNHFINNGQYEGRLGNGDGYLTSNQKKQKQAAQAEAKQQAAAQAEANNPVITDANQIAVAMFNNINARRAADGTAPMVWDDSYAAVAQQRAVAISQPGGFSHDGLPYGYGECIKFDPGSGMRLNSITFANSAEHDNALRNPAYTKVGVGVYCEKGATHVSVVFN